MVIKLENEKFCGLNINMKNKRIKKRRGDKHWWSFQKWLIDSNHKKDLSFFHQASFDA